MKKVIMILGKEFSGDIRVYREAQFLIKKGYSVEILSWDRENRKKKYPKEIIDGIKIKRFFPYSKYGTGVKQILPFIKYIKSCKQYLKNHDYDFIHCHDLDGMIAGKIVNSKKVNVIFDMHEFYEGQTNNKIIKFIIRKIVNYFAKISNHVIYVNEAQKNNVKNTHRNKFIHLPNYPDLTIFKNTRKSFSDKLRFSYIGVVRQYSELANLIEVCKEFDDIEVYIHGNGIAYEELRKKADSLKNVFVTGKYDFQISNSLYANTDVLYAVYPTDTAQNRISLPIKLYEAIITKTPVIASKNTSLEEFILEKEIGFSVIENDLNSIRNVIQKIRENRKLLDEKIENIKKIQFEYTWEKVIARIGIIYK